jgi:hypothetical protein
LRQHIVGSWNLLWAFGFIAETKALEWIEAVHQAADQKI